MGLIQQIVEWASLGAKIEPLTSWIQNGWQYRQRPQRQYWNWFENHRDEKINALIDAESSLRTISPGADYTSMCEGLNPDWADPMTSRNYLSTGTAIKDSCIGWDHDNNKPVLYVLQGNNIYPVDAPWDHSAAPSLGSALSLTYNQTPVDVMGICSDGDYLFVVYGVSGSYIYLAKFSLISFTGTDLWGVSTGLTYSVVPDSTISDFIVIDSDRIGLLIATIAQPAYMEVFSILKTTGAWNKGYGNGTSSDYMTPKESRLVSDGARVYWLVYEASGGSRQYYLNSALISAPTGSPFARISIGASVSDVNYSDHFSGVALCRGKILCGTTMGEIFMYTPGDASSVDLIDAQNLSDNTENYPIILKSDGLNVWLFTLTGAFGGTYVFYRIPSGYFSDSLVSGSIDVDRILIDENSFTAGYKIGNLLFDGRDMWMVSQPGDLLRICAPGLR